MGQACSDEGVSGASHSGSDAIKRYGAGSESSNTSSAPSAAASSSESSSSSSSSSGGGNNNNNNGAIREFTKYYSEGVTVASLVVVGPSTVVSGGDDGLVLAFDIVSGEPVRRWKGHGRGVTDLSVSGAVLASSSRDKSVCLWSLEGLVGGAGGGVAGSAAAGAAAAAAAEAATTAAGAEAATTAAATRAAATTATTAAEALPPTHTLKGHKMSVTAVALSPDGSLAASGSRGGAMILWDAKTGTKKWRSQIARNIVTCAEWVPASMVVVQGSEDLVGFEGMGSLEKKWRTVDSQSHRLHLARWHHMS